jgi:hypothetical protein
MIASGAMFAEAALAHIGGRRLHGPSGGIAEAAAAAGSQLEYASGRGLPARRLCALSPSSSPEPQARAVRAGGPAAREPGAHGARR